MSALLKALAEPRRVKIVGLTYGRELPAGAIHRALGDVTFGAVSQHLRVLREAGALRVRKEGRHRLYQADAAVLEPFREHLERFWDDALVRLRTLAQAEERRRDRLAVKLRNARGEREARGGTARPPILQGRSASAAAEAPITGRLRAGANPTQSELAHALDRHSARGAQRRRGETLSKRMTLATERKKR